MRQVIYVRILHDLFRDGTLRLNDNQKQLLKEPIEYITRIIDKQWDNIDKNLSNHKISKIYQDSYCGGTWDLEKAIKYQFKPSERNTQTIYSFIEKGAVLMPTEKEELLAEFHMRAQNSKYNLSDNRDKYIAKNIDNTLKLNETAVLFLGRAHHADKLLKKYKSIYTTVYDPDPNIDMGLINKIYALAAKIKYSR